MPAPPGTASITATPVSVAGDRLVRGSEPWWFLGYNSFTWSGNCGDPGETMTQQQVDLWFSSMRHDGHGAVRLFFFPGWDESRLDATVAAARRNGIYVIITLADALGNCGQDKVDAAWFSDRDKVGAYRDHLVAMLTRFRGDPTVAWFEWFNEPGWNDGKLLPFLEQMHRVAAGVDPSRLFSSGTIAPYALGGPEDFTALSRSAAVDVVSLHEYDQDQVESSHGPETVAAAAGKPVVVGEFGIEAGPGCDVGFADRADRVRAKAAVYTRPPYSGALMWAWQPGGTAVCDLGNLDADAATQGALRTAGG